LRIAGEQEVAILDRPKPEPAAGEVIVRMKATGICGSDLHPYRHPSPLHLDPGFISGHEPCGVIEELGAGVAIKRRREDRAGRVFEAVTPRAQTVAGLPPESSIGGRSERARLAERGTLESPSGPGG